MKKTHNRWVPLILTGWVALSVSVLIPVVVSTSAFLQIREMRCTQDFEHSFAPLLVTCGERSPLVVTFGWGMTIATLGAFVVAAVVAALAVVGASAASHDALRRLEARTLAWTVIAVILAVAAIIATGPDGLWGTSSWIFFSAWGSALVMVFAAIVRQANRRALKDSG